jgi:hypothetical protein
MVLSIFTLVLRVVFSVAVCYDSNVRMLWFLCMTSLSLSYSLSLTLSFSLLLSLSLTLSFAFSFSLCRLMSEATDDDDEEVLKVYPAVDLEYGADLNLRMAFIRAFLAVSNPRSSRPGNVA